MSFEDKGYTVKRKQRKPDPWDDDDMSNAEERFKNGDFDPNEQTEDLEEAAQNEELAQQIEDEQPEMSDFIEKPEHSLEMATKRADIIADLIISEGLDHNCIPCILTHTANIVTLILCKVINPGQRAQALASIMKDTAEMLLEAEEQKNG
jgi:hypothetical protein